VLTLICYFFRGGGGGGWFPWLRVTSALPPLNEPVTEPLPGFGAGFPPPVDGVLLVIPIWLLDMAVSPIMRAFYR